MEKMRSGSTFFLKTSLLFCVWCYCFGNNKRKGSAATGRKTMDADKNGGSGKRKKNSFPGRGSSSSTKLNDSSAMQGSVASIRIDNEDTLKGYVNPDFYIPFIDSSDDTSTAASTLKKNRKITKPDGVSPVEKIIPAVETIAAQQLTSVIVVDSNPPTGDTVYDNDKVNDNDKVINDQKMPAETKEQENNVDRSNCSSVKSSDFVVVLETARNNEEEILKVRNSYYEKLAEAAFIPISVHDEIVEDTVNFQLVTEELRKVGDKYLVSNIRPTLETVNDIRLVREISEIELPRDSLPILHKLESLDSGLSSQNSNVPDKGPVSNGTINLLTPKSPASPTYNSKSSECLKKTESNNASDKTPVKWHSVEDKRQFEGEPEDTGLLMIRSNNLAKQVVTTTIVQTATTTLTQVSKRFSDNWKEFEIKTRRVVRSNSRASNASSDGADDLRDLHITVQSEQGEPKELVDETSRVVSQPHDTRVTSEYLTNLSHMLIDDCRKFHKDKTNGSQTPSECSELEDITLSQRHNPTLESTRLNNIEKSKSNNVVRSQYHNAEDTVEESSLSEVIASIKHTIAQAGPQRHSIVEDKTFDINGNKPFEAYPTEAKLESSADTVLLNGNEIKKAPHATLVISLHLAATNLLENESDFAPLKSNLEKDLKSGSDTEPVVQKTEKLVIIRETYQPNDLEFDNHELSRQFDEPVTTMIDEDSPVEDINIRRAREAAAFAQKYFQQGYKYS